MTIATSTPGKPIAHSVFTIRRRLPFKPEQVFAAWTNPAAKARWFAGGGGWTEQLREMDFRVGGRERVIGKWATGTGTSSTSDFQAIYHDIVSNRRIVYSYDMFVGETKLSVSLASIEFQADGANATQLVLTEQGAFFDEKDPPMREHGTHLLVDQLTSALYGVAPVGPDVDQREIVITRLINAPRELVYAAWTDPQHVGKWWGPTGFTTTTTERDVRPGGLWRFTMHGPDGTDFPSEVRYLQVAKPERLVYMHGDGGDGPNAKIFQVTVSFEAAEGNKTQLTLRSVFPTAAARKHVVEVYHAIEGGNQTLDRLQAFLASQG
jgi:uncharacterized protein YndB with AHSA1/START domain